MSTNGTHGHKGIKISIEFCAECGYEPQTASLARALMEEFGLKLASIELIPAHDGAFDVTVGDTVVHSMLRHGGFPEHETIFEAVRKRLTTVRS